MALCNSFRDEKKSSAIFNVANFDYLWRKNKILGNTAEANIIQRGIQRQQKDVDIPVESISWHTLSKCTLQESGQPYGQFNNIKMRRNDMLVNNYQFDPIIGSSIQLYSNAIDTFLLDAFGGMIPVYMDVIINPLIIIWFIIFIVFVILVVFIKKNVQVD